MGTFNEPACISEMQREAATWKRPAVLQYDTSPALMCLGSTGDSERGKGASSIVVSKPQQNTGSSRSP